MVCRFLAKILQARQAEVVVQGARSRPFQIANQVFQGTVLGPPAWNVFFADVAAAVQAADFEESLFADDLTCTREFNNDTLEQDVRNAMDECQQSVHEWGSQNRVLFDASKEQFVIVHPFHGAGPCFKYLGCVIDCKLVMNLEIDRIVSKCKNPKSKGSFAPVVFIASAISSGSSNVMFGKYWKERAVQFPTPIRHSLNELIDCKNASRKTLG